MTYQQNALPKLPHNWAWSEVGYLCDVQTGPFGTQLHKTDYATSGIQVIEIGDVYPNRNLADGAAHFVSKEKAEQLTRYEVRSGDILFTRVGTVGRCTKVPSACNSWLMSTSLIRVRPRLKDQILSSFLLYYFWSPIAQSFARVSSKGTTRAGTNSTIVEKLPLALAPINEQKRIVSTVEELFSFLDAGVESLRKVQAQLKRYRQAVLKYAFEGKLTEEWRKTHKNQIEPATKILEQISQGNALESNLSELPEGWIWTHLELITANHDGKRVPVSRKKRESMKGVYPYYGASGIIDSVDNYLFDGNFLLLGEDGANLLARATPIAFQATGKFWVNNHAHVLTPLGGIPVSYLEHYINRISLAEYVTGTAQPKLTQRAMNKIPVPLAPLKEQYKIAEEISRRFSVIDEISKEMELMIKYSDRLWQSILKTAFEGKLIPQDPNDEPAEKLLKRIKAERFNRESKFHNQLELSGYVK